MHPRQRRWVLTLRASILNPGRLPCLPSQLRVARPHGLHRFAGYEMKTHRRPVRRWSKECWFVACAELKGVGGVLLCEPSRVASGEEGERGGR